MSPGFRSGPFPQHPDPTGVLLTLSSALLTLPLHLVPMVHVALHRTVAGMQRLPSTGNRRKISWQEVKEHKIWLEMKQSVWVIKCWSDYHGLQYTACHLQFSGSDIFPKREVIAQQWTKSGEFMECVYVIDQTGWPQWSPQASLPRLCM